MNDDYLRGAAEYLEKQGIRYPEQIRHIIEHGWPKTLGVPDNRPTACMRPPWWRTLERIDADRVKLLEAFRQSFKLGKGSKK